MRKCSRTLNLGALDVGKSMQLNLSGLLYWNVGNGRGSNIHYGLTETMKSYRENPDGEANQNT